MEYTVLGWPADGPTLRLDHERFSYAGKFVMSNTGKAVARERDGTESSARSDGLVAAVAFNEDRTDAATAWLRYVTVRADRRGEGVGARLAAFAAERLHDRGYERVRIAVNNPFAFHALSKAGFGYTGERTGIAELVLERPGDRSTAAYQAGLDEFRDRDLSAAETSFLSAKAGEAPPELVASPR
ncbi:GNAT family N-acetyltransferase [Halomicrococcus gelatinilyticus]|uniref:GNAT family N-acetyltransferase n=1 Tax=Halomicrococcus gelatinilyticus TaxID=1702103 RepID=UPI002E0DD166